MAIVTRTEYPLFNISCVTLANLKTQLEELIGKYGEDATLDYSSEEDGLVVWVNYKYAETSAEESLRLEREAKQKAYTEQYERKQYEALKKKFENN